LHTYAQLNADVLSKQKDALRPILQTLPDRQNLFTRPKAMAKRAPPKPGSHVTAQDVARTLGVSQSTISRAFSMTASISEEMKLRVIKAANKLGYQPNVIARSLITRKTNMVAIVMANLVDPFYPVVLDELVQHVQAAGFQTLLFVPSEGQKIDDIMPSLLQYQVDAIILTSATISSAMARICAARETPVISFNRYVPDLKIHAVSSDNVAGGRQVADYLVATGHERFAFVSAQRDATTNRDRRSGFLSRLKQLKIDSCLQEEGGEFSYEAGYAATKRLLRQASRPDALFFASDVMAFGGIDAARELGLGVPGDVSIVGYDDVPLAALPSYGLTTIRQPVREMAQAAMEILGLAGERNARSAPENRIIRGTLITRSSTRDRGSMSRLSRSASS
jgi:DNA-binding LacI/PurR family transcriptional regulator